MDTKCRLANLMPGLAEGDSEAWTNFERSPLYLYWKKRVWETFSTDDAAEVMHQAVIGLYKQLKRDIDQGKIKYVSAYFGKIVDRRIIDQYENESRKAREHSLDDYENKYQYNRKSRNARKQPLDDYENKYLCGLAGYTRIVNNIAIEQVLQNIRETACEAGVSDEAWDTLVKHYADEVPFREIAKQKGESVNTVKSRTLRTRDQIRYLLEENGKMRDKEVLF